MKLKIFKYKKVKSTNDAAIRLIKKGVESGLVSADIQTNGKGQRGNKWVSKKGNLFITIFFGDPITVVFPFSKIFDLHIFKKFKTLRRSSY